MDLQRYLDERRRLVEDALDRFIPRADDPPQRLHESIRYSVLAPGKRIRAILVIAGAEAVRGYTGDGGPALAATWGAPKAMRCDRRNNILVVDDDPATLDVVSDTLHSVGYTPHAVSSGKEALELLSKVRMDAILLDLMMPEMDGFDVLRTIKDNTELEEIPVFIVTAKDLTEAESRLLKQQSRALFRKDQSWKADLLAQLHKAVGKPALAKTVGQS